MADEDFKLSAKIEADLSGLDKGIQQAEAKLRQASPKLNAASGLNFGTGGGGGAMPGGWQRGPAAFSFGGPNVTASDINKWTQAQWEGAEATKKLDKTFKDVLKQVGGGIGVLGAIGVATQLGNAVAIAGGPGGGLGGRATHLAALSAFRSAATSVPIIGGPAWELSELGNRFTPKGTVGGEIMVGQARMQETIKGFTAGQRGYGAMVGGRRASMADIDIKRAQMRAAGASPEDINRYTMDALKNYLSETNTQEAERRIGFGRMDTAISAGRLGAMGMTMQASLMAIQGNMKADLAMAELEKDPEKAKRIRAMGNTQMLAAVLGGAGPGTEISGAAMSLGGIRASGLGLSGDEVQELLREISAKLDNYTPPAARN